MSYLLNKIEQEKTISEAQLPQILQTDSKKSLISWSLTFLNLSALLMTPDMEEVQLKEKLLGPIPIYWIMLPILVKLFFRTLPETSDDPIANEHSALLRIATTVKILFEHWFHRIFLFVSGMKEILEKLINPIPVPPGRYSDQEILQESVFTQIFLKFAQICFLNPEVGEASKKCLKIRNKTVGYISDVRFYQHETKAGSPHLLMLMVEVKNNGLSQTDGDKDSATPWIEGHLDKCILEQIGLQLMSDIWNSTFAPSTLAVVCFRTEVIFMLLESDLEHYEAWLLNKNVDNFKSCIQYTRSYNIMVADDRRQLLDLLFWLGCIQKGDFERYFFF
ncbi:unnamed protein product [Mytilus edulis]|uniref:Uncharacterized protein n=1 Tax=Mytilus edulis TaxID=6550 RepID=A0A8S3RTX6_MYTED|nr:unnamed protein product [Mytilus edulis]